jgi:hypothetical protein
MKKLLFLFAMMLMLTGCDMVFHEPKDGDVKTDTATKHDYDTSFAIKSGSSPRYLQEVFNPTISNDKLVFYFRIPGTSPDGFPLKYFIESQPVRGMFVVDPITGDFYITKTHFDRLKEYSGKQFIVYLYTLHGADKNKFKYEFNIDFPAVNGRHYIKRDIA